MGLFNVLTMIFGPEGEPDAPSAAEPSSAAERDAFNACAPSIRAVGRAGAPPTAPEKHVDAAEVPGTPVGSSSFTTPRASVTPEPGADQCVEVPPRAAEPWSVGSAPKKAAAPGGQPEEAPQATTPNSFRTGPGAMGSSPRSAFAPTLEADAPASPFGSHDHGEPQAAPAARNDAPARAGTECSVRGASDGGQ